MMEQEMNSKNTFIKKFIENWITLDIALLAHDEEAIKEGQEILRDLVIEYKDEHKKEFK